MELELELECGGEVSLRGCFKGRRELAICFAVADIQIAISISVGWDGIEGTDGITDYARISLAAASHAGASRAGSLCGG